MADGVCQGHRHAAHVGEALVAGLMDFFTQPMGGLGGQEAGGLGGFQDLAGVLGPALMVPRAQRGLVMAQGFGQMGDQRQKRQVQNATAQFLLKRGIATDPQEAELFAQSPELIQFVMKSKGNLINAGDGRLYNQETGEWIVAPGGSGGSDNRPSAIQEYEYGRANPEFLDWQKTNKGRDSSLTTVDKKAIFEAEDELPAVDGTLSALNRAKELNTKTYTGYTAGARGWAGANLPGGSAVFDEETSKNTLEFNNLMSFESIKTMADTLKGATTDFELNKFVQILADPSTPPEIRERTIDRMIKLAERKKQTAEDRIKKLRGGDYYDAPVAPGATVPAPAPDFSTMTDEQLRELAK